MLATTLGCGGSPAQTPASAPVTTATPQLISATTEAAPRSEVTDTAVIAGRNYFLVDTGERCLLRFDGASGQGGGEFAVDPKAPCYFVHDEPGKAQVFAYTKMGVDAVAIIVGTALSPEDHEFRGVPADACGGELQGLLIKAGQPSASRLVLRESVGCRDFSLDEKYFRDFAQRGQ
jgi:hypothetical protein